MYNAFLDECASDPVQASSQLFIRNYLLDADSRVNLTVYTNVRMFVLVSTRCICRRRLCKQFWTHPNQRPAD